MGIIHADPVPQFADNPWLRSPGQYASDHVGVSCQQIAEVILDIDSADITFANIPGTYRDLLVLANLRNDHSGTGADLAYMQFNADAGANYRSSSSATTTGIFIGNNPNAGTPVNEVGTFRFWVFDYSRTAWKKTAQGQNTFNQPVAFTIANNGGFWAVTDAITQIRIYPASGNFVATSRATLWGFV